MRNRENTAKVENHPNQVWSWSESRANELLTKDIEFVMENEYPDFLLGYVGHILLNMFENKETPAFMLTGFEILENIDYTKTMVMAFVLERDHDAQAFDRALNKAFEEVIREENIEFLGRFGTAHVKGRVYDRVLVNYPFKKV